MRVISRTGYRWSFGLADARGLLLATHVGDEPLTHGHGAPCRLVAPGRRGFQWVKWVERIEVHEDPDPGALRLDGVEQLHARRGAAKADPGACPHGDGRVGPERETPTGWGGHLMGWILVAIIVVLLCVGAVLMLKQRRTAGAA